MKHLLLLLLSCSSLHALTKDEVIEISSQPHSRDKITEPIAFFPDVRTYEVKITLEFPKKIEVENPIIVSDKIVEGKYKVSTYKVGPYDLIRVTEYSDSDLCYYDWTYNKQLDKLFKYRGLRLGETNQISWHTTLPLHDGEPQTTSLEEYHENHVIWTNRDYKDGKLSFAMSGTATKLSL